MPTVELIRHDDVGVILIDHPPVNALATSVREQLIAAVQALAADPALTCGVIATTGRSFIAGADIREMARPPEAPILPEVIEALAQCEKPLVAALKGATLGGGLEIALACRGRVAAAGSSLGFPEVRIGLVPGAGGTQMLLRLVRFGDAVRLVTSGRPIAAEEALQLGLIHRIAEGDVLPAALVFARELAGGAHAAEAPPLARIRARPAAAPALGELEQLTAEVRKAARGQQAPVSALELMTLSPRLDYAQGVGEERSIFVHLRASREAKALRRLFLAERETGRLPELDGVRPRDVKAVGVVGAGLMGCGIAYASLLAGFPVSIVEGNEAALERGKARMVELMEFAETSGRLASAQRQKMEAALIWATDLRALATRDLVIEAVFEDLAVKHQVFARLDSVVRNDAILATNTSYLDLDVIAAGTAHPSRVIGLHFFSPAHVMRLLEVVRGRETAREVLAAGIAFGRALGKIPVVTAVCEGFCGNRILRAYRNVAEAIVEDGASPAEVDRSMTDYGFPMGPFAVQDMAGLEISYANRKLNPAVRPDGRQLGVVEMLVDAGRLGRKNGRGWYSYQEGARTPVSDPEVMALLDMHRIRREIPQRTFYGLEIQNALLAAIRDEGAAILAEGIVARPEDIDLVMVHGYGYPAHKGGPMFDE